MHCNLWRPLLWAQHCYQGAGVWLVTHVQCQKKSMEYRYKGFYSSNYVAITSKTVNDIHKRGGTVLGTSRGGHDTKKIVDNIQDRGINQVYIIGGDGTQKGAYEIYKGPSRW